MAKKSKDQKAARGDAFKKKERDARELKTEYKLRKKEIRKEMKKLKTERKSINRALKSLKKGNNNTSHDGVSVKGVAKIEIKAEIKEPEQRGKNRSREGRTGAENRSREGRTGAEIKAERGEKEQRGENRSRERRTGAAVANFVIFFVFFVALIVSLFLSLSFSLSLCSGKVGHRETEQIPPKTGPAGTDFVFVFYQTMGLG